MKKAVQLIIGNVLMALAPLVLITMMSYTMTLPQIYEAEAKIMLHEDQADTDAFIRQGKDVIFNPLYLRSQFVIIKSRQILDKVSDNLALQKEWGKKFNEDKSPIHRDFVFAILVKMIDVQPYRDTSLITVRVRMEDGSEVALIANEIVKVYRDYRMEQKRVQVKKGTEVSPGEAILQRNPVEIIEPAQPTSVPVSPNLFLNMMVAIVMAGGLVVVGLILVLIGVFSGRKKAMPPRLSPPSAINHQP